MYTFITFLLHPQRMSNAYIHRILIAKLVNKSCITLYDCMCINYIEICVRPETLMVDLCHIPSGVGKISILVHVREHV